MFTPRLAAAASAAIVVLFFLRILYLSFAEDAFHYESILWLNSGHKEHGTTNSSSGEYLIGVGKADITGPVVELNLMGYANTSQLGSGLRQRLYSRAFIVGEPSSIEHRWIYLVLDTQSGDTAIRDGILQGIAALGPEYAMYGRHNIAVTGTHSHSGPGAWLNYLLPQITSRGFSKESYEAIVEGAVRSIRRAHESLALGSIEVGKTRIEDANINRSLYAYLANPEAERKKYQDDVDKELTLLRFKRANDGADIGVLTWFAVHGTSMLGNNTLITGDNKGVAAYLFEKSMRDQGNADFVAGFSQANVGDTSPNVLGAYCEDGSGEMCQLKDSTCGGRNQDCHGRGPFFGQDDAGTKSCFEIGRRQFQGAKKLHEDMAEKQDGLILTGGAVRSLHTFVSLANYTFTHPNGSVVSTCPAALGYGFAAGTSDGPGAFDFKQNSSRSGNASPVWAVVRDLLHSPDEEQRHCQYPKPILLDVGETMRPYQWAPNIVDIQMFRAGQLLIIISPGEATTMAGRRWRGALHDAAISSALLGDGIDSRSEPIVLLGGPANSYTHYITTEEEYAVQRYEGASTLYGPHTLNAYIDLTLANLPYLSSAAKKHPDPGPSPPVNTNRSLSFITGVVIDRAGWGRDFGDVLEDVKPTYRAGEVASVRFVGANPRNNLRLEQTYAQLEISGPPSSTDRDIDELRARGGEEVWSVYRTDADWELVFHWARTSTVLGTSEVQIEWEAPVDTEKDRTFRMRYFGDAKSLGGMITPFEGVSGTFTIT